MKDLVVVSYAFAPMIHAASQRAFKFVRYLPKSGYRPIVVTVKKAPFSLGRIDDSMIAKLPPSVMVERTRVPESLAFRAMPNKWLFLPDYSIGWHLPAVRRGNEMIEKYDVGGIFAVAPPYTSILAGATLKKKHKDLPYIADLSDPWVENPHVKYPTRLHRSIDQRLEKYVVRNADRVLVVSEQIQKMMQKKYGDREKFVVSPLSFDPENYVNAKRKPGPMRISYIGSLYGDLFTPKHFLSALTELIDSGELKRDDIEVTFVGKYFREPKRLLEEFSEKHGVVKTTGTLPSEELMEIMCSSDVLLLIINDIPGSKGYVTTKLMEYLPTGNRILALVPGDGDASKIIRKTGTGTIAHPRNKESIKKAILSLHEDFQQGKLRRRDISSRVKEYSAANQAGVLAKLFTELGKN